MNRRVKFSGLIRLTFVFVIGVCGQVPAQVRTSPIIAQSAALQHGLRRSWLNQVSMDRSRDKLQNLVLDGDALFAQTTRGLLHVFDAETGGTRWIVQVGRREHPSTIPAVNATHVAIVNGSILYVLDRTDGHVVLEKQLNWVPSISGGPALCPAWVCCPSMTGSLESISLKEPETKKWYFTSNGRIDVAPLATRKGVVWGTSAGYLYFSAQDEAKVRFQFPTRNAISAPLAYWPPLVIAASRDGYVYAIDELAGTTPWRFSSGTAINEQPAVIDGAVYICAEHGGMHRLSAEKGADDNHWFASRAVRFISASKDRVYAADQFGDLLILDAQTGGLLNLMKASSLSIKMLNVQNDRMYLGTLSGLIQCLHEDGLDKPMVHMLPPEPLEESPTKQETGAEPAAQPQGAPE